MNILQKIIVVLLAGFLCGETLSAASSSDTKMDRFIDGLMSKMTLHEKIGQLNLCGAGDVYTGPVVRSNIAERIRKGEVGGILSLKGVSYIRSIQEVAVKESRLGIPVILEKMLFMVTRRYSLFRWEYRAVGTWKRLRNRHVLPLSRQVPMVSAGLIRPWWIFAGMPAGDVCQKVRVKMYS